jgi:hypothetical protein
MAQLGHVVRAVRIARPPDVGERRLQVEGYVRGREVIGSYPEVVTVVSQHGRPDDGADARLGAVHVDADGGLAGPRTSPVLS